MNVTSLRARLDKIERDVLPNLQPCVVTLWRHGGGEPVRHKTLKIYGPGRIEEEHHDRS